MLAYKFRISAAKAVQRNFEQTLSVCQQLYNAALQERRDAYRLNGISINYHSQAMQLPEIKAIRGDVGSVYSQVLQDVLRRCQRSFDNFFRRIKKGDKRVGFPRFKSKNSFDSFCYPQSGFRLDGEKLTLSKLGSVKVKLHRKIVGAIKTCTIKRESNGWYVIFTVETIQTQITTTVQNPVGLDMGLICFATLSNGGKIKNQRFFESDEKALATAGKRLSAERKGSQEFKKRVKVLQKIYRRIRNRRNNFAHQESRRLVDSFDAIFFENLNITKMMRTGFLAKGIADAAWSQLISFTLYKAANAGKVCKTVNPKGTSQECSGCGEVVKKDLSVRVHHCLDCGLEICRDLNASLNILCRGLATLGNQAIKAITEHCSVME